MKIKATITKINKQSDSTIKASAKVELDGLFAIHGIKVVESQKGLFAAMPGWSHKDSAGNKQYNDYFHAITKEAHEKLNKAVLDAYERALSQEQSGIEIIGSETDSFAQAM